MSNELSAVTIDPFDAMMSNKKYKKNVQILIASISLALLLSLPLFRLLHAHYFFVNMQYHRQYAPLMDASAWRVYPA